LKGTTISAVMLVGAALLTLACGGDGGGDSETATPATTAGSSVPGELPDAFLLYRVASGDMVAQNLATGESYTQSVNPNEEVLVTAQCTPDGSRIAYLKQNFDETTRQLVVRGRDALAEPLSLPSTTQNVGWSPDGTRLAVADYDGFESIHTISVLDIASGETTELTSGRDFAGSLAWSPDGERIAYYLQRVSDGATDIFAVAAEGGEPEQLTPEGDTPWYDADWAPDGSGLLVAGLLGEVFQLFKLDPETGDTTQITDSDIFKRGAEYSPDGSLIAYTGSIILPAVASYVDSAALHSFGIFLLNSDGSNERAFTADPRQNPGAAVDPFLDAYLMGWCSPGPWLDDLWTSGAPETPAPAATP